MAFSKFILRVQINNAFLFHDNRFNSISLKRKIKIGVSDLLSTSTIFKIAGAIEKDEIKYIESRKLGYGYRC